MAILFGSYNDIAQHDGFDRVRGDTGPPDCLGNHQRAEFCRGNILQAAAEIADRRAGRGKDIDRFHLAVFYRGAIRSAPSSLTDAPFI